MSSTTFPSTGKPKFNPNAAFEAVEETPVSKGKKPAFNPKASYDIINDHDGNYSTILNSNEENNYQQWKSKLPTNLQNDTDYDLRGLYKNNPTVKPSSNLHFKDTYKKPNHITFSDESIYNNPEKGVIGGRWANENGKDVFYASEQNIKNAGGEKQLEDYFKRVEPNVKLVIPQKKQSFEVKLSDPTFKSAPAQIGERTFTDQKPVDELAPIKLQRKAQLAYEKIQPELASNKDVKEGMIRQRRADIEYMNAKQSKSDMPKTSSDITIQRLIKPEPRAYDLPVTDEDITNEEKAIQSDRGAAINFLEHTMKKYPEKAKEIQKHLYTIDAYNSLTPDQGNRVDKIEENRKQIEKGNLIYDAKSGRLIKPLGLLGSAIEGWKQKSQLFADYDFLKNTVNDAAIAMDLEERRNKHDMDEPIPIPKGKLSEAMHMIGGMPIKPILGGTIAGLAGPEASMVAGGAIGAREFAKLSYASDFQKVYNELRDKGVEQFEAVRQARKQAEQAAEVGAVTGAAMGLIGGRLGAKPITTPAISSSFKQAAFNVLKSAGKEVGKAGLEGLAVGGLGAAGEVYKNKLAKEIGINRPLDEGVAEQIEGGLLMTVAMAAAIKGGRGITKANYKSLLHGLSQQSEETINTALNEKVQNGEITQKAADETLQRINDYKGLDMLIPDNVTEEARFKIQDKILKRNELNDKLETIDKAYHPEIKEKIKAIDEEIINLTKENKEKPQKPESGLSREQEKDATEFAEELVHEGILPDTYSEAVKKDPIGFWKTIAQQAQNRDENWKPLSEPIEESAVREQYGDTVVDYAKELFPAPELPKVSENVSVIQPGEIKHPETITIKPQSDALSIGKSEEIHVGEASGNSPEMGARIPESGETSNAQEGIGTENQGKSQEEIGAPPIEPTQAPGIHVERPATQLSFRGLQEVANEFGYEDVKVRDKVSDIQERKNAEITANEWAQKGEYQANIDDLLNRIENKEHVPTAKQRLILEQYLANERQKLRELPKTSEEYDRQLLKVKRIKDIGNIARSEAGAALRLPQGGSLPHPIVDEESAMIAKMEANNVDKLTDQQKAEVTEHVERYKKAADEANEKTAQLEAQVAKMEAEKEFKKVKSTTKREKKTAAERIAYRRSEIEAAREALKKLRTGESGLSAVPLPGVRELMAIAPHVKNIMVDLVAQGVDNLQDVVSHLHNEFKDILEGLTEKNIHDIIAGEYNEKAKPLSELQRQIRDIRDEAKYINQLESLLNGKEPKNEKAKVERNRKIKDLKDKIKSFKQEEADANKFYGESDVTERKLDKLRDELERIQNRREKTQNGSAEEKEISAREQELRDKIKQAQDEWDKEKEAAAQAKKDYSRMETERNRQLQRVSDLKQKLENLQKGIKNKGTKAKKVDTPEIESLKEQIKEAESNLNKTIATEKRVEKLEEELQRLKDRRDKEPKEVEKREISDREKELKSQIEEERKAFRNEQKEQDTFYKEEIDEDAKKLIAIKKRNDKRTQEIKAQISRGEFDKEVKKSIFDREDIKRNYPRLRKDALDAIAKKEDAQHEFDLALFNDEMAKRNWAQKWIRDFGIKLIHTSKAVMSGIDDSATFVQNGLAMLANPRTGAKVFIEHWKDAFSDARFKRELAAIHSRPDWDIIEKSGLQIVEPHSAASKQVEEAFEKNLLAGKIKIKGEEYQPWKYTGGIFERAFTSMGNNMRLSLFDKRMAMLKEEGKTFESHPQEYKDAARAINELTGRGQLPAPLALSSPYITPFIWAPRLLTSTINTLGLSDLVLGVAHKGYYQNLTPLQRKFALYQLGRGIAVGVGVMGAAALGGADVDWDPRSVTFGDIIIGTHHYNVFGRYTPVIKTIVQAAMGERLKKGIVQDLDSGKFGAKTRVGVIGGFFRGKMTPAAGVAYDLLEHRNYYTQKPFTIKDVPQALIEPLSVRDLLQGWDQDGTTTILTRFLPAFEGLKVSDERDFEQKGITNAGSAAKAKKEKSHKTSKPHR